VVSLERAQKSMYKKYSTTVSRHGSELLMGHLSMTSMELYLVHTCCIRYSKSTRAAQNEPRLLSAFPIAIRTCEERQRAGERLSAEATCIQTPTRTKDKKWPNKSQTRICLRRRLASILPRRMLAALRSGLPRMAGRKRALSTWRDRR